jgi:ketosteroid isomerase-like protein
MGRTQIDLLLRELYAARLSGDLDAVCRVFSADAMFQIASASRTSPVAIKAAGVNEFRPLLAFIMKTFRLGDFSIRTIKIDGAQATVHWTADVRSRITGATVPTEMVDLAEVHDGLVVNFNEVFVAR